MTNPETEQFYADVEAELEAERDEEREGPCCPDPIYAARTFCGCWR